MNPDPTSPAASQLPDDELRQEQGEREENEILAKARHRAGDAGEGERLRQENADYRSGQHYAADRLTIIGAMLGLSGKCFHQFGYGNIENAIAALREQLAAAERERDVYRAIIEAATLESVDKVSADGMRERFVTISDRLADAEAALERVRGLIERWDGSPPGVTAYTCADELEAALENTNG